jgi:hypothetical protein
MSDVVDRLFEWFSLAWAGQCYKTKKLLRVSPQDRNADNESAEA